MDMVLEVLEEKPVLVLTLQFTVMALVKIVAAAIVMDLVQAKVYVVE